MSQTGISYFYSAWSSAARDIGDPGNHLPSQGQAGTHPEIGPYDKWTVGWLYSMSQLDNRMHEVAFGNSELDMGWPVAVREGKLAKRLARSDTVGSSTGLGHVADITDRISATWIDMSVATAADRIMAIGPVTTAGWSDQKHISQGHLADMHSVEYMLTGDFFHLEAMWFWAGFQAMIPAGSTQCCDPLGGNASGRGPTGAEGGPGYEITPRYVARPLQIRTVAAGMTPSDLPERGYFNDLTNDWLASEEGEHLISGTPYSQSSNAFKFMYDWGAKNKSGKVRWDPTKVLLGWTGFGFNSGTVSPLNFWTVGNAGNIICNSSSSNLLNYLVADCTKTWGGEQVWEEHMLAFALKRAKDFSFPSDSLLSYNCTFFTGMTQANKYYLQADPGIPTIDALRMSWIGAWSSMPNYIASADQQVLAWQFSGGADYHVNRASQVSYGCYEKPGGPSIWTIIKSEIMSPNLAKYQADPQYALIPREAITGNSASTSKCDLNGDGRIDILDIQLAINEALGAAPCTNGDINSDGSCNVQDVQSLINSVMTGTCLFS